MSTRRTWRSGGVGRRLLSLAAAAAAALAARPGHAQSMRFAQPNAARFPEVTLYSLPLDARSLPITGLGTEDFQVTENGQPAPVLGVESNGGTLDVCLALDASRSMREGRKFEFAQAAALEFARQLRPTDQAALISFGNGCTLDSPLGQDRRSLEGAIQALEPNGLYTTFLDGVYWSVTQVALRRNALGGSVLGTSAPARADARRVVLILTDGNDNGSHVMTQQVIDYARANGVSVCTVALGDDAAVTDLMYLAQQTGGINLRAPSPQDLEQLYTGLAQQLQREYRVTYRSPRPVADGTRRQVRLQLASAPVTGEGWYQAPGQGSLLVTVGPAAGSSAVAEARAPEGYPAAAGPAPATLWGALLGVIGLGGLIAVFLFWSANRRRPLAITDSNPRLDLMPLWVRAGSTRVGRGAECELVLDSHEVSRVHARIEALNGTYAVIDEGSRNGTYVNGKRVRDRRPIQVGDVVRFGDREFRFAGMLH